MKPRKIEIGQAQPRVIEGSADAKAAA
jgi:hypothetical protein